MSRDDAYVAGVSDTEDTFRAYLANHVPSLSNEDESDIYNVMVRITSMDEAADVADLARRTCSCGEKIDGFYEYVDHLKEVFDG